VTDTGTGIANDDLPVLFSKFGKLQRTAAMNDTGIGLGLTIVKQIVEQSQGSVHAKSPGIGKGSTFSFNMVIETAEQAESRESSNYSRKNGDIANHLQENLPAIDFDKESRKS